MADPAVSLDRVLVIVPTYNEAENVPPIVARLRAAVPQADILIADDNSPDGTGAIADGIAATDPQVHVLHRKGKEGLGAAYVAGFTWGLDRGYDVLVEHDADGSHKPEQLPLLLERLKTADVVKGSRWVKGGRVVNWSKSRELLSRGGNLWTRLCLGIPVKDVTGGFAAWRAIKSGFTVAEVPIEFSDRTMGDSKMSSAIVVEAMLLTTRWGIKHRFGQARQAAEQAGLTKENLDKATESAGEVATKTGRSLGAWAQRCSAAVARGAAAVRARLGSSDNPRS